MVTNQYASPTISDVFSLFTLGGCAGWVSNQQASPKIGDFKIA